MNASWGLVLYGLLRSQLMTAVTFSSIQTYLIRTPPPVDIVVSVDGHKDWIPKLLKLNPDSRFENRSISNSTFVSYTRALRHVLYGMHILKRCKMSVISRVDVEYASYLNFPSLLNFKTIVIPSFQHHGQLNDRFCYGHTSTTHAWFVKRLQLANENHTISEKGACLAAKHLNLRIQTSDIKFVRRRHDLFVPDIDKATVWKTITLRNWMTNHEQSCM